MTTKITEERHLLSLSRSLLCSHRHCHNHRCYYYCTVTVTAVTLTVTAQSQSLTHVIRLERQGLQRSVLQSQLPVRSFHLFAGTEGEREGGGEKEWEEREERKRERKRKEEIIKKVRKVKEMVSIEYEEYSEGVGSESRMPGTDITPLQHFIQSQRLNMRSQTRT